MNRVMKEFVSNEPREYSFKVGRTLASSLAGFVGGAVFASIAWLLVIYYLKNAA